jgi:hypothetical protein
MIKRLLSLVFALTVGLGLAVETQARGAAFFGVQQLDANTRTWAASVVTNGGAAPSPQQIQALNGFIVPLVVSGAWAKLDDLSLYAMESAIAARTTLKKRRLQGVTSSPTFIQWYGYQTTGTQFIDTLFKPSVDASQGTATNFELGTAEGINTPVATYSMGAQGTGTDGLRFIPRSGGGQWSLTAGAASTNALSGSLDTTAINSAYRNGTSWGFYSNGVDPGPLTPGFTYTQLPAVNFYVGCQNNGGAAQSCRNNIYREWHFGAQLTVAQEAVLAGAFQNYSLGIPNGAPSVYVSSVSANGVAVGVDASCAAGIATPCLTFDKALTLTPARGTILFNGTTASPVLYRTASASPNFSSSITLDAMQSRGAILAGYDTTRSFTISSTNGATIKIQNLIIDPSQNTNGAAFRAFELLAEPIPYTLVLNNVLIRNWGNNPAIYGAGTNIRANLALTSTDFSGDQVQSGVSIGSFAAGSVNINGGTYTLARQSSSTQGGCVWVGGVTTAVTVSVRNIICNMTLDPALTGTAIHSAVWAQDIAGVQFDGLTVNVYGHPGSRTAINVGINVNPTTPANRLPIDGGSITNSTGYNESNGGIIFALGGDSGDATKANNMFAQNLTANGDVAGRFASLGGHGFLSGWTTNSIADNIQTRYTGALAFGFKHTVGGTIKNSGALDSSGFMICKASNNVIFQNNTVTASTWANNVKLFYVEYDTAQGVDDCNNVQLLGSHLINNGATGVIMAFVEPGSTATFGGGNDYHNTSGTQAANPWSYRGTTYSTFSAWKLAHDPTATSNLP